MRTFGLPGKSISPFLLLTLIFLFANLPSSRGEVEGEANPLTGRVKDAEQIRMEALGFKFTENGVQVQRGFTPTEYSNKFYKTPLKWINDYPQENIRKPTPSKMGGGFRNWKKLDHGPTSFTKRNGHASAVFKCPPMHPVPDETCLWITGGRSEDYQGYDLEFTRRNADVFYSNTGEEWSQVDNLDGDYVDGIGNFNAKFPGKRSVAPWYSRFGHSLSPLDANADGKDDAMVIAGGFNPEAANDVWITADGVTWAFDGYAPFAARAWHATTVFRGQLYVIGGTPLTNDVWTGNLTMKTGFNCGSSKKEKCLGYYSEEYGYSSAYNMTMVWKQKVSHMNEDLPFSPRSGHCLVTQLRRNDWNNTYDDSMTDRMFLIGGFASWPVDDPRYDAERSRNDIYETLDGKNWTKLKPPFDEETQTQPMSMPWAARAWQGCATLHDPRQRHVDLSEAAQYDYEMYSEFDGEIGNQVMHPKMFIVGGGYIGSKRNHVVRKMEAYVDMWYSRDGIDWKRVHYQEGKGNSLFTSQDWAQTSVEDVDVFIGKWGFTMEVFNRTEDLNLNSQINADQVEFDFAGSLIPEPDATGTITFPTNAEFWRSINWKVNRTESNIPSLYIIGGDTVDNGGLVNDVFESQSGILCELDGVACSGRGVCGPGVMGCICQDLQYLGEYCERLNLNFKSGAFLAYLGWINVGVSVVIAVWLAI